LSQIIIIITTSTVTDPRVNDWPLMESPIPTVIIVAAYLYVVLVLGPRLMANRKPFQLNTVLVTYNALQVLFSFAMLWEVRRSNTVQSLSHYLNIPSQLTLSLLMPYIYIYIYIWNS
jgi:hypothetical protein